MRIGIDIASLAYKKQVEQIILIAGDSDFVPAAKLVYFPSLLKIAVVWLSIILLLMNIIA